MKYSDVKSQELVSARKQVTAMVALAGAAAALVACNSDGGGSGSSSGGCTPVSNAQSRLSSLLASNPLVSPQMKARNKANFSHIPRVVKNMRDAGVMDESQVVEVTVALSLNNEDELDDRLTAIYQPGNPNYRKYIRADEFGRRYAPTNEQIVQAASFLSAQGITVSSVSDSGLLIHASGSIGALNQAFQTEIHQYDGGTSTPSGLRYAPAYEPTMPAGLSIKAVHGLESPVKLHHHAVANVTPQNGSGVGGGLTPANIHSAYGIPTNLNGSGQTIALVELDGYRPTDITAYENAFGLGATVVEALGAGGGPVLSPGENSDEVTLDIELATAIAPGATIKVYEATNSTSSLLTLYDSIAQDSSVQEVSTSWGMAEGEFSASFLQSESAVFQEMAAAGVAFFAASGDSGADANGSSLSVEDPSTQPFVVAVGGTHLNSDSSGHYLSETTWGDGAAEATGGGVSTAWTIPSWQSGLANSTNRVSNSMRNVPDVSLNADPESGYSIYLNGAWTIYGGTSCAAPLWAAFVALVNQQREASGQSTLGYPNPYLYALGSNGASYSASFHDIEDGSSNGYFPAVPGFDDATGWGTIKGSSLLNDLATDAKQSTPGC